MAADKAAIAKKQETLRKVVATDNKADDKADNKMDKMHHELEEKSEHLEKMEKKLEEKKAATQKKFEPPKAEPAPEPEPETKVATEKEEKKEKEEPKPKNKAWSVCNYWPFPWGCTDVEKVEPSADASPKKKAPVVVPVAKVSGMGQAKEDIEKAKVEFGKCQYDLKVAKDQLKDLMASLEKAKAVHKEADAKKADALYVHETHVKKELKLHNDFEKALKEYQAAQKAYAKQQERVAKLKRDLKASSALVKGHRNDEDANGGVYNTGNPKESFANLKSASPLLALMAAFAACW